MATIRSRLGSREGGRERERDTCLKRLKIWILNTRDELEGRYQTKRSLQSLTYNTIRTNTHTHTHIQGCVSALVFKMFITFSHDKIMLYPLTSIYV